MTIAPAVLDAMLAAGCSAEQIVAAVKADAESAIDRAAHKREVDAARKRRQRAKSADCHDMSRGQSVTPQDIADMSLSPKESSPTPPKEITPNPQTSVIPNGITPPPAEIDIAIQSYSEMAERAGLAVCRIVNRGRAAKVAGILRQYGMPMWLEALARVEASDFLRGENDRGWKADLDFILQPKSFAKLMDGGYGTQRPAARAAPLGGKPSRSDVFKNLRQQVRDGQPADGRNTGPDGDRGKLLSLPSRAG